MILGLIPDWFAKGSILLAFWGITGLIVLVLGRNRLRMRLYGEFRSAGAAFIQELTAEFLANPEKIKPLTDAIMKSVLNSPTGIIPKEATVKLPVLGKVPASWFEPYVKKFMANLGNEGVAKVEEALKNPFDKGKA